MFSSPPVTLGELRQLAIDVGSRMFATHEYLEAIPPQAEPRKQVATGSESRPNTNVRCSNCCRFGHVGSECRLPACLWDFCCGKIGHISCMCTGNL